MKRFLSLTVFVGLVDLLCPDVSTGAHAAIAPVIIAAIIGAVGSAVAAQKNQQAAQDAATGQAAAKKGGIDIEPAFEKSMEAKVQSAVPGNVAFATGAQSEPYKAGDLAATLTGMQGAMTPESKQQQEIEKANAGKNVGYPLTPPQAEQFGTGNLLTKDFGASGEDITAGAPKEGMSFDEKMQMAALVAQLGSAVAGPGAPPPPGAPRGGGIGMSPVFQQMTARNIYG